MKKRWAATDDARAKQEAEDRAYEREKKWARKDAEREAIRRERERFREERALRIEALAVQHKVRDNNWKAEQVCFLSVDLLSIRLTYTGFHIVQKSCTLVYFIFISFLFIVLIFISGERSV